MSDLILVFTHYGYSSYLEYTLDCARRTNPDARLVLLGDQQNRGVAKRYGWEHRLMEDTPSRFQSRFRKVFRHVQGSKHNHLRSGRDWLRYVFERWFFVEGFVAHESIHRFWHFDSDTMVLQDLRPHDQELRNVDFSVQCNNMCLNGIASADVVTEFCDHICQLFENAEYLSKQQEEFDSINPGFAFTEMRAFDNYKGLTLRPWLHLLNYRPNRVFDDCICHEHGLEMCLLPSGEKVKKVYSRDGKIYGTRGDQEVEFISLNLSWVPDYVFQWVLASVEGKASRIENAPCPLKYSVLGMVRKMSRFVGHG